MQTVQNSSNDLAKYIQGFITKGPVVKADASLKIKADIKLRNSQLAKLQKLQVVAKGKATSAKSKVALAKKSGVPKAIKMADAAQKQADGDVLKVNSAIRKIRTQRDADSADLATELQKAQQGATEEET